jgi:microcystin-dependent protein
VSQPFLGMIQTFAFNFAPKGWALCNGQLLSIQQNQALFALLGTTYGGNGVQNFGLPNLQSRTPLGYGNSSTGNYTLGEIGGVETVTLTTPQLPLHNHTLSGNTGAGTTDTPTASTSLGNGTNAGSPGPFTVQMYSSATPSGNVLTAASVGTNGSNQPHSNLMPYLTISVCIALSGIFPSRN